MGYRAEDTGTEWTRWDGVNLYVPGATTPGFVADDRPVPGTTLVRVVRRVTIRRGWVTSTEVPGKTEGETETFRGNEVRGPGCTVGERN